VGAAAGHASAVCISTNDYLSKADPRHSTRNGELLLGLKIENTRALANVEETLAVPHAFRMGPGRHGHALGHRRARSAVSARYGGPRTSWPPAKNNVAFLEMVTPENVVDQIQAASWSAPYRTPKKPPRSSRHTNRPKPW
jgi:hypothetical protein